MLKAFQHVGILETSGTAVSVQKLRYEQKGCMRTRRMDLLDAHEKALTCAGKQAQQHSGKTSFETVPATLRRS